MSVEAHITEERLSAEMVTEHININITNESILVNFGEDQINVEIKEETLHVNFSNVVAIIERALEQGIPFSDPTYLYVVFSTDVKRTNRITFEVDYVFFVTKPTTLTDVQALF